MRNYLNVFDHDDQWEYQMAQKKTSKLNTRRTELSPAPGFKNRIRELSQIRGLAEKAMPFDKPAKEMDYLEADGALYKVAEWAKGEWDRRHPDDTAIITVHPEGGYCLVPLQDFTKAAALRNLTVEQLTRIIGATTSRFLSIGGMPTNLIERPVPEAASAVQPPTQSLDVGTQSEPATSKLVLNVPSPDMSSSTSPKALPTESQPELKDKTKRRQPDGVASQKNVPRDKRLHKVKSLQNMTDDRRLCEMLSSENFPDDFQAQSQWAWAEFKRIYPTCPLGIKESDYKHQLFLLQQIALKGGKPTTERKPAAKPSRQGRKKARTISTPVHAQASKPGLEPEVAGETNNSSSSPNIEPTTTADVPAKLQEPKKSEIHEDVRIRGLLMRSERKRRKRYERQLYGDRNRLRRLAAERFPNDPQAQSSWAIEEFANLWGDQTSLVSEAVLARVERQLHAIRQQKSVAPIALATVGGAAIEKSENPKTPAQQSELRKKPFIVLPPMVSAPLIVEPEERDLNVSEDGFSLLRNKPVGIGFSIAKEKATPLYSQVRPPQSSQPQASPVDISSRIAGIHHGKAEGNEIPARQAKLPKHISQSQKEKRPAGKLPRSVLIAKRDELIEKAKSQFPGQPAAQRAWALAQWQAIYPKRPHSVKVGVWNNVIQPLEQLGPPQPPKAVTPVTSAPLAPDEMSPPQAVPIEPTAPALTDKPILPAKQIAVASRLRGKPHSSLLDQQRIRLYLDLAEERDRIFDEALRSFPEQPTAASAWARRQWSQNHKRCPRLVDIKFFNGLGSSLARTEFRKAEAAIAAVAPPQHTLPELHTELEDLLNLYTETPAESAAQHHEIEEAELTEPLEESVIEAAVVEEVAVVMEDMDQASPVGDQDNGSDIDEEEMEEDNDDEGIVLYFPPAGSTSHTKPVATTSSGTSALILARARTISTSSSKPQGFQIRMAIGPGGRPDTIPRTPMTYLIQAGVEFTASEPKATVHALAGSVVHLPRDGSRVIRYPGATIYGEGEYDEAAKDDIDDMEAEAMAEIMADE